MTTTEELMRAQMNEAGVPSHTMGGIINWVLYAIPGGSFLNSVITNDLFGAFGSADGENSKALKNIVSYFYNYLPMGCFGEDALENWKGLLKSPEVKES